MSKHPMPASPLPWFKSGETPVRPYTVAQTSPYENGPRIVRGNPTGGGPYYAAKTQEEYAQDRDYILWAANTAPALAAEVERLRAALEKICDGALQEIPDRDVSGTPEEAWSNGADCAWAKLAEIARRALEAK